MSGDVQTITAVIDETSPSDRRGIYYVVTAAVMLDAAVVRDRLATVLPSQRVRPFHWANEGPEARSRMLDLITEAGVVAHVIVHYPTGRRRQEEARRLAMLELVPTLVADGVSDLTIESRSPREDQRDQASVLDALRDLDTELRYSWSTKSEPLLWVADAVCGVIKEYLLGEATAAYEKLCAARALDAPRYRLLPEKA